MLTVNERRVGTRTILAVHGEVDLASAPALRGRGRRAVESASGNVALDLSDVDFVDSAGLGVLIGMRRRAAELGGELVLVEPSAPVRRVLDASGVASLFRVVAATALDTDRS